MIILSYIVHGHACVFQSVEKEREWGGGGDLDIYIICSTILTYFYFSAARSPVFSAMFEHSMEESIKVYAIIVI